MDIRPKIRIFTKAENKLEKSQSVRHRWREREKKKLLKVIYHQLIVTYAMVFFELSVHKMKEVNSIKSSIVMDTTFSLDLQFSLSTRVKSCLFTCYIVKSRCYFQILKIHSSGPLFVFSFLLSLLSFLVCLLITINSLTVKQIHLLYIQNLFNSKG